MNPALSPFIDNNLLATKGSIYMLFRILKSLFSNDAVKTPIANDAEGLIALLTNISNGLGEYASVAFNEKNPSEKNEKALEMLSTITEIEKTNMQLKSSELFYSIAVAYRNYCAWFVRGDNRKQYLVVSARYHNT